MERNQVRRQLSSMRKSLIHQGYVDEQFIELEELQDDANPNFAEEVVTSFFRDSSRVLHCLEQVLEKNPLDFAKLETYIHQLFSRCSSIGAKKVRNECTQLRENCRASNAAGCKRTFQQLKKEYATLKKKMESYFQFARQSGPFETACPPK